MSGTTLHQKVQQRLGVKYVAAKELTDQALEQLGMDNQKYDEYCVVEMVDYIFAKLSEEQQNEMRVGNAVGSGSNPNDDNKPEPEWKRKARLAAEKRENEWRLAQQQQQGGQENEQGGSTSSNLDRNILQDEEPLQPGQTRVTSSTTTSSTTTVTVSKEGKPIKKEGKWHPVKKEDMPENFEKENPDKTKHVKVLCTIM